MQIDYIQRNKGITAVTFIILALICLVLGGWYSKASDEASLSIDDPIIMDISLRKVEIVSNEHVGNSWEFEGFVNGKELKIGDTISIPLGIKDTLNYQAKAEEHDSIPDKGSKETLTNIENLNFKNIAVTNLEVTVRENRGRYSGHQAIIRFKFTASRHVTFSDVIRHMFK